MDAYFSAIQRLPQPLRTAMEQIQSEQVSQVQEIRLRSGRTPVLVLPSGQIPLQGGVLLSHAQLKQCFYALCNNSVHSYQQELVKGFFTLPGGHRVGVAGVAGYSADGAFTGMRIVTSLDIRVAREIHVPLPPVLLQALRQEGGLLLAGPPGSGKTTLLRSVAHALSSQEKRVVLIDERGELMPCGQQGFVYAPPLHCDVIAGLPKAQAILMALRSLSPQVILCDEVGGMQDVAALEQGLYSGVNFVASIHGKDLEGLRRRPQFVQLQKLGAFRACAFLAGPEKPGTICAVESLC